MPPSLGVVLLLTLRLGPTLAANASELVLRADVYEYYDERKLVLKAYSYDDYPGYFWLSIDNQWRAFPKLGLSENELFESRFYSFFRRPHSFIARVYRNTVTSFRLDGHVLTALGDVIKFPSPHDQAIVDKSGYLWAVETLGSDNLNSTRPFKLISFCRSVLEAKNTCHNIHIERKSLSIIEYSLQFQFVMGDLIYLVMQIHDLRNGYYNVLIRLDAPMLLAKGILFEGFSSILLSKGRTDPETISVITRQDRQLIYVIGDKVYTHTYGQLEVGLDRARSECSDRRHGANFVTLFVQEGFKHCNKSSDLVHSSLKPTIHQTFNIHPRTLFIDTFFLGDSLQRPTYVSLVQSEIGHLFYVCDLSLMADLDVACSAERLSDVNPIPLVRLFDPSYADYATIIRDPRGRRIRRHYPIISADRCYTLKDCFSCEMYAYRCEFKKGICVKRSWHPPPGPRLNTCLRIEAVRYRKTLQRMEIVTSVRPLRVKESLYLCLSDDPLCLNNTRAEGEDTNWRVSLSEAQYMSLDKVRVMYLRAVGERLFAEAEIGELGLDSNNWTSSYVLAAIIVAGFVLSISVVVYLLVHFKNLFSDDLGDPSESVRTTGPRSKSKSKSKSKSRSRTYRTSVDMSDIRQTRSGSFYC